MSRFVLTTFIAIILAACSTANKEQPVVYFDLKSILESQTLELLKSNPKVRKEVDLDGAIEELEEQYDSLGWAREFEIFLDHDINKSAFVGGFTEIKEDALITYVRKDPDSDGVKEFKITYEKGSSTLKTIVIIASTTNSLYQSSTNLKLDFIQYSGNPRLSTYEVRGSQSILSGGETNYSLKAQIIY